MSIEERSAARREALQQCRRRVSVDDLAVLLIEIGEIIMGAIEDLQTSVTKLEANVTAENEALGTIAANLRSVSDQLTQLQQQVASGAAINPADLETLAARVAAVADSAAQATQAAEAPPAAPPAPPPTPDPVPAPTP